MVSPVATDERMDGAPPESQRRTSLSAADETGDTSPDGPSQQLDQNRTLWLGDIEAWMDEAFIMQVFSSLGNVHGAKVLRDRRNPRNTGYAFLTFSTHEEAVATMEASRVGGALSVCGYHFRVNWAMYQYGASLSSFANSGSLPADISLWVGNMGDEMQDVDLFGLFHKRYGSVVGARVILDQTGSSRGYGFVRFRDAAEANQAQAEMEGMFFNGRALKVKPAAHPTGGPSSHGVAQHVCTVAVLGVDASVTETELSRLFGVFGPVAGVRVTKELNRAAVEFTNSAYAEAVAAHLHGHRTTLARTEVWWQDMVATFAALGGQPSIPADVATAYIRQAHMNQQAEALASQPGLTHFKTLLQDPEFVDVFQRHHASLQVHFKWESLLDLKEAPGF